ncbi:MAG: hypothetical protein MJ156_00455 [Alphaproteobacteria bacterium]|nr:hypothetical protein [Alphaproteobacteria bacterium]
MDKVDFSDALAQQNQQKALLNDALKQRQGFMYNLASALAQTPVQQGHGSWLSAFTNAFGRGYQGAVESAIQQQKSQDLSSALQSGNLSDAAKVAAAYGDTGLAQQLLGAQATNEYRQAQLEESRLNREFNRAIKEQELAQKAAEEEAQRQYLLDKLGVEREGMAATQAQKQADLEFRRQELEGTQAYRQGQLDLQRAQMEQKAAQDEAQRAYLMDKLGAEQQIAQGEQALKQAQLEQTGAYNTAKLAQEQAKLDQEIAQQKATADYYAGKNVDYSKLPVSALKEIVEKQEKMQKESEQKSAAKGALKDLNELAESGKITALNKATDNWVLSKESSKNIGKREAALAALLPLTNSIARASGGSGINTLGEMMAYLGIPENATSAQIAGALPGISRKLGIEIPGVKSETPKTTSAYDYSKYGF